MSDQKTRVVKAPNVKTQSDSCLVMIYGPELGKKYLLSGSEVFNIGREDNNFIVVDQDNVSRRHACVRRSGEKFVIEDLKSTNGTFLNDDEVKGPMDLRSGDLIKVGSAIFKFLTGGNVESQYHDAIYNLTIRDGLTQIPNKRYFLEFLEREMGRAHRYDRALSLLIFDIDHFKSINDSVGHLAGDYVLRELARIVDEVVRREECFARYGGEEFAYVIPEVGGEKARRVAEKARRLVEGHRFSFESKPIKVTISIGVADLTREMLEPSSFIKLADQRLYAAKRGGRNRVVGE